MIIAISRTILLHTVLPSPDVSPPVQSLLKSSQSSLPSSSPPPWSPPLPSPPSPPSSRRPAYRSRGPTQTSMGEAGGAPSDKHFSTSDSPRALPGLVWSGQLHWRQIGEISDKRKQEKCARWIQSGFFLLCQSVLSSLFKLSTAPSPSASPPTLFRVLPQPIDVDHHRVNLASMQVQCIRGRTMNSWIMRIIRSV